MENKYLTTQDMFNACVEKIKSEGRWPEDIDYVLASDAFEIKVTEFTPFFKVNFGGNEGIYLDIFIDFESQEYISDNEFLHCIGCVKTLSDDDDSLRRYAALGADFQLAIYEYRRANFDTLRRTGFTNVYYKKKGICDLLKEAEQLKDKSAYEYEERIAVSFRKSFIRVEYSDCNEGWDYTLYNFGLKEMDGGVLEMPFESNIVDVLSEVFKMFWDEDDYSLRDDLLVFDYDEFMECEDAELYVSSYTYNPEQEKPQEWLMDVNNYYGFECIDNDTKAVVMSTIK